MTNPTAKRTAGRSSGAGSMPRSPTAVARKVVKTKAMNPIAAVKLIQLMKPATKPTGMLRLRPIHT